MKTTILLVPLACALLFVLSGAGATVPPSPYCHINHQTFPDQYVTYSGFFTVTVGVLFLDGSPSCQVQVVCGGTLGNVAFVCSRPPLP